MKIGYVCTNYNNSSETITAVQSLLQTTSFEQFEIIVVDNNSSSEVKKQLTEFSKPFKNVHVILKENNAGYFGGLNIGISFLRNHFNIAYMIVGNNDLIFPKDFYENFNKSRKILETHPVVSPDIITEGGIHQNPHVIKAVSPMREMVYDLYYSNYLLASVIKKIAALTKRFSDRSDESHFKRAQPIYQGHGSCYILTPLFFMHYKKLWAPTFLMSEEFFLSVQLMKQGMQVYYEPNIKVVHKCHSSLGKLPGKRVWNFAKQAHKEYRKYIDAWGKITYPTDEVMNVN